MYDDFVKCGISKMFTKYICLNFGIDVAYQMIRPIHMSTLIKVSINLVALMHDFEDLVVFE